MYFQLTEAARFRAYTFRQLEVYVPPRKHPLIERRVLEDLYFQQRLSLSAIGERLGVPYSLVRASFKAHGLTWRSKAEAATGQPKPEPVRAKIAASRRGHRDTPEVAAQKRQVLARVAGWMKGVPLDDPRRVRQHAALANAMKRPEVRDTMSKLRVRQIQAGGYYDRGYHESPKAGRVYYMSGWELRRWLELDNDPEVSTYLRSPCGIPYLWEDSPHRYVPDVLITYRDGRQVLEEIKPEKLLSRPHRGQAKLLAKVRAGQAFAVSQGWEWRVLSYN